MSDCDIHELTYMYVNKHIVSYRIVSYFAVRVDNVEFPGFSLIIVNNRRWYTVLDLAGVC